MGAADDVALIGSSSLVGSWSRMAYTRSSGSAEIGGEVLSRESMRAGVRGWSWRRVGLQEAPAVACRYVSQ